MKRPSTRLRRLAEAPAGEGGREAAVGLLAEVVRDQFRAHPALARANGDHEKDGLVAETGGAAEARRCQELAKLREELHQADPGGDPDLRLDLEIARSTVERELFDLEVRRRPFTDPTSVLDGDSPLDVGGYLLRDYAPLAERMSGLCQQLEQAPEWAETALSMLEPNLAGPLIELALEGVEGQRNFFRDDIARAAGDLGEPQLRERVGRAAQLGEEVLDRIVAELERRRPDAHQQASLGPERLVQMLLLQEGVERSVAELRQEADSELESLLEQRNRLLTDQFGGRDLADVRGDEERNHFAEADLIPGTASLLEELRGFVERHGEVPIPEGPHCEVRPSPGFMTAWVSAAYEGVGLLETRELPCIYYVTVPQPSWKGQETEEWLRYMNRATLKNISVHEVYPGHHVQYLYSRHLVSDLRRFFWTPGFGEGWAHYAELLMIEAGLAEADPILRLSQIEEALLRACRYRTAVGLHADGWQVEDGTRLFMGRVGMEELPARREAARGTYDPLYLVYTLGKLQILRWREEWLSRQRGDLRAFHRRVLAAGSPPLAALERWLQAN